MMGKLFVRWLSVVVILGVGAVASAQFPPEHLVPTVPGYFVPVIKAQMKAAADLEKEGQYGVALTLTYKLHYQGRRALQAGKLPGEVRGKLTVMVAELKRSLARLRKKAGIFRRQEPDLKILDDLMKRLDKMAKAGEYQKAMIAFSRLNGQLKTALAKKDLSPKLRAELTSRAAEVMRTNADLRNRQGLFNLDEREVVRGRILRLTETSLLVRPHGMKEMEFPLIRNSVGNLSLWYKFLVEIKARGDGVAVTFGRYGEKIFVTGMASWEPKAAFEKLASNTAVRMQCVVNSTWLQDNEIAKRDQILSAYKKLKVAIQHAIERRKYGLYDDLKDKADRFSKDFRELSNAQNARLRKTYTLESDSRKLVTAISKAALDEKRKKLILKLRSVLAELFGLQANMKRLKLKRLEREVSRLKEILKVRDANKGEIIESRVQELINPTREGSHTLRWNTSR